MDSIQLIDSSKLPTLSRTLSELIELERKDSVSYILDFKRIVEKDPLLSAHILKTANSPLYGFSQKVRSLSHAISLLGVRKIRNIAFGFSIFDFIKKVKFEPKYGQTFNHILKKSLLISALSSILAQKVNYLNADELYTSGLLADIGQFIFFLHDPKLYSEIYSFNEDVLIDNEIKTFGFDHIELGKVLAGKWFLSDYISRAIENHYELKDADDSGKIIYLANSLSRVLLTDEKRESKQVFKELEVQLNQLLDIPLSVVLDTVKSLPQMIDAFIIDMPELQKDLRRVLVTGSDMIMSLMKKKMDMAIRTQELSETQRQLSNEKTFLSHMLNLSYVFSSQLPPRKVISSLFEYFNEFVIDFSIDFIYKDPLKNDFFYISQDGVADDLKIDIEDFSSLKKAKITNEYVKLTPQELGKLDKSEGSKFYAFPISYHHKFFGFILLDMGTDNTPVSDFEISYIGILANIIGNAFQNYYSFDKMKKEINKKEVIIRELSASDQRLNASKKYLIELQKNEVQAEILPVVFHKLKNKLTPILGYSQILQTKVKDEGVKARISKIERNANELSELLNILKDYYKNEPLQKETDNLNTILRNMKKYFSEVEKNEGIELELKLGRNLPDGPFYTGQIETMIMQLTGNAVQAIKQKGDGKGKITLITERKEGGYRLLVRDNGIGLSEDVKDRMYIPFYSNFEGRAGIGLSLCEKITDNHDAIIRAFSVTGQYTEVEVAFPSSISEMAEERLAEQKPAPRPDLSQKRILIVDDEEFLVDLMKDILESEFNLSVLATTKGAEAIEFMKKHSFDLIISDIHMPDIDGVEIFNFLKKKNQEEKILMVTANPHDNHIAKFIKENQIVYIKKPFELMKFKKIVFEKLS